MNGLSAQSRPALLDQLGTLGDATRSRILLLLEHHEVTVAELCAILQAPQSTVSRHLKALADNGWVLSRAEGTSRLYAMANGEIDAGARRLWQLVRQEMARTATAVQDGRRLHQVLAERRSKSQEFFHASAGQWEQLRDQLFGRHVNAAVLPGLLDEDWSFADLGCGSGGLAELVAPYVGQVVGVDDSAAMVQAARKRTRSRKNVEIRRGRLEDLPLEDSTFDVATCVLVLHHIAEPGAALREASRILRPGGRLLVADMLPHDREQFRRQMGHVWLGFSEKQMLGYFESAGLTAARFHEIAPDAQANGPGLFVATGRKNGTRTRTPEPVSRKENP